MDCKKIVKERRIEAFEKLGFGIFVHFGLYSQLGRGEWAAFLEKMESADYAKLKDSFVVRDDFAENLVLTAKRCGANTVLSRSFITRLWIGHRKVLRTIFRHIRNISETV